MISLPIEHSVLIAACQDARRREEYTENKSFSREHNKYHRLCTGAQAVLAIHDLCKKRNVPSRLLTSDYRVPDSGDILIRENRIDVKTSENLLRCQVHLPNKRTKVYVFCSLDTTKNGDRNHNILHIWGWQYSDEVIRREYFIPYGKQLPGESLKQAFKDGSYIYPPDKLRPIEELLHA